MRDPSLGDSSDWRDLFLGFHEPIHRGEQHENVAKINKVYATELMAIARAQRVGRELLSDRQR